jgi:CheY-like chemotaxis protein
VDTFAARARLLVDERCSALLARIAVSGIARHVDLSFSPARQRRDRDVTHRSSIELRSNSGEPTVLDHAVRAGATDVPRFAGMVDAGLPTRGKERRSGSSRVGIDASRVRSRSRHTVAVPNLLVLGLVAPHSSSRIPAGSKPCGEIRIVLVDDDEAFRAGLAGLFRDDGHEVRDFAHPGLVPAFDRLGNVALLVTDLDMPGKTGFRLADEFHAAHPDVPVILITAFQGQSVEAEAARRPFLHLLHKPMQYEAVHAEAHRLAR